MPIANSPTSPVPGAASRDVACVIVRLMAGLTMILYNSWLMVHQGWEFLWRQGDWALLNVATDLGFPMPKVSACVIASVYFFGSIFLILGVFGRVTSALLLVATEIGFYFALQAGAIAYAELSILYGALYILHLIMGNGRISLDRLLARLGRPRFRRRRKAVPL